MRRRAVRGLRRGLLVIVAVVAAAVALAAGPGKVLESTELSTVDLRFEVRGERPQPAGVAVVGVDDVTFSDLHDERFPFNRHRFARVLSAVAADHPRLIVYDVQFTEASDDPSADDALILASRRAGNAVFSTTEVGANGQTNVFGGRQGQRIARATVGNGLLPEGKGGVLRRIPYAVDGLPSLAVAAMQRLHRPPDRRAFSGGGAWIDFAGPPRTVRFASFSRVLRHRFAPGTFRDRVVVIGATAPSLQDQHPTSWPAGDMSGPEIQASAIDTLLRGAPLRSAAGWVGVLLTVVLALLAPLAALRLRPGVAFAIALVAGLAYAVVVQLAFDGGRILPLVAPLLGLATGLVGSLGVHYLTASVERAQVRDLFARFVPDSVVDQVLAKADLEDPRLGGVRMLSTVMFSDLRGFTTFAERLEPEQVIEVLNRYLSLMSDAILDHGGTLVAYMGDGIMAVFGAPIGADDHADRALAAARAMLSRLDEFNGWMREQGYGDGFKMGIGLNSGHVMSGNVGSARRLEYTAIGDTTNTAARLEGMTKGTPHQLYVSQSTVDALSARPDDLDYVDELEVRGRQGRLAVWALRATVESSA